MSRPQVGDQVQRHAFSGAPYRKAFCGVVTGSNGKTVRILGDDGAVWDAEPTELVPAGMPWPGACACSCCPLPTRSQMQLELF